MNFINRIATFLAILGVIIIILALFNRVPNILRWMDSWGDTASWIIKIAILAGACFLWFTTRPRGNDYERGPDFE